MRRFALVWIVLLLWGCERRPVFTPADWIKVAAGSFKMGSPVDESCREPGGVKETQHQVTLTHAFLIQSTETTQGQFENELGFNPSGFVSCGPDCPVEKVTWNEAVAYCNALSKANKLEVCYDCNKQTGDCFEAPSFTGKKIYACPGYRLPTEAEWEYAVRAGTTTAFYSGPVTSCKGYDASANTIGWFHANSGMTLHLAGRKEPNDWGLHDMSGSVWEWVHDWYDGDLGSDPVIDPAGPEQQTLGRVLRGGSCQVEAQYLRSASRYTSASPSVKIPLHGFRCVKTEK